MKKNLISIAVLVVIAAGFFVFNSFTYNEKKSNDTAEPYRTSFSGEYICLPYKENREPQTDECVFGLKTDIGEYYGIDFALMSQIHNPIEIGQMISASGVVVPVERLSADHWKQYPIKGIFSVTDSLQILEEKF